MFFRQRLSTSSQTCGRDPEGLGTCEQISESHPNVIELASSLSNRFGDNARFACGLLFLLLTLLPMPSTSETEQGSLSKNTIKLRDCPDSPNCVSSLARSESHRVEPISYRGPAAVAFAALRKIIEDHRGTRVIEASDVYLHAEFQTRWLKFTDDFEAVLDEAASVIHVRSASRVGYWDLGTNRRRVETIREAMQDWLKRNES